ncbi:threonine--tRNA ligase [Candidatus Uhrbacteria bacterium RIFCSPHIGHO2_12_FULL_54_23]|uniref:Threonine--tRNA ligase n=1 Tax=Candidatus Uhrbacteria bacterium RIFCSPHIGHO2_12_FULL_54_23 TaxID=1802397 RepID=A0A1F7UK49_9BACT|nr:MAG: threonine--tRNA ligase [Candidatus Uhrbacteria bacterium RIFCSPHIGHO2_12_FULL_54_23]
MDKDYLNSLRHSCSHLLAAAVLELYPNAKPTLGPPIDDGFYYDFDFSAPISENDLPRIEEKMNQLIKVWRGFERSEVPSDEAKQRYANNPYKRELIEEFSAQGQTISFYKAGDFEDLCRGGHVENPSKELKHFKLLSVAGAYWRGSEKNKMLTRIYGTAFPTKEKLEEYLHRREEAKKRDHKKLGKELGLFVFADEVGPGLPLFTEKGTTIYRELERFVVDEEIKRGYVHVRTPDLARVKLYEISGHYPYYKDSMYPVMEVDDERLVLRPMTCPHHFILYKSKKHSYRELPLRMAEVAKLYRYEQSGELMGLLRVRSFCLADSHMFCARNQAASVVKEVIDLIDYVAKTLGLARGTDYWFRLSLGDRSKKDKYYDDPKNWEIGEATLRKVLEEIDAPFVEAENEAAFYGPKIDVQMLNVNGKEDTAFTVQYDFCLPARFALTFTNDKGEEEQPVVIHRSSIGALERTFAYLIERYAGAFPVWLSPVQVAVLPVKTDHNEPAHTFADELKKEGIRVSVDDSNETIGQKIRKASGEKIPYQLVFGDKEINSNELMVRVRGEKEQIRLTRATFIQRAKQEIAERKDVRIQ